MLNRQDENHFSLGVIRNFVLQQREKGYLVPALGLRVEWGSGFISGYRQGEGGKDRFSHQPS